MAKKKVKKKTKKKLKKATKRPAKPRKKARKPRIQPIYGLHEKKLDIMAEVPVMPCSVISRDMRGLRFAHTRAEKVFQQYSELCRQKRIVTRLVDLTMETLEFPFKISEDKILELLSKISLTNFWPWTRAIGKWEIENQATGQTETFMGSGLGNNDVWSDNSAQTVAFQQALLMYFFTAWPQPTDFLKIIRESLEEISPEDKLEAFKQIFPPEAWNILTAIGAVKELTKFYGGKSNGKPTRNKKPK